MASGDACDFMVLGLEASGKSVLIRRLACLHDRDKMLAFAADAVPTLGTETTDVTAPRGAPFRKLVLREVGGAMAPIWPNYYSEATAGVVVCVDAGDSASFAPATVELYELLGHAALKDKPCLLVLNKCDVPMTASQAEVELTFSLSDLEHASQGRLRVARTSGLTGQGCSSVLAWMVERKCARMGVPPPVTAKDLGSDGSALGLASARASFASSFIDV